MSEIEQIQGLMDQATARFSDIGERIDEGTVKFVDASQGFGAHEDIKSEGRDLCVEINRAGDIDTLLTKLGKLTTLLGEGITLDTNIAQKLDEALSNYSAAYDNLSGGMALLRQIYGASRGDRPAEDPGSVAQNIQYALRHAGNTQNTLTNVYMHTRDVQERVKAAAKNFGVLQAKVGGLPEQLSVIGDAIEEVRGGIYEVDGDSTWHTILAEQAMHVIEQTSRDPAARGPARENDHTLESIRNARRHL